MVRPGFSLEDPAPEPNVNSPGGSSESVLNGLLLVALLGLAVRVVAAALMACRDLTVTVDGKGLEVAPLVFFGKVILNFSLKVLATSSQGLLAVKWILAGEPASYALVACFVLVAVNTQMLVSVVQVTHMRDLLLKLGIQKRHRLTFAGIGGLLEVAGGRACVVVNGLATICLVVHLRHRPWQLLPWLATAAGTLAWANATFEGIGGSAWKDLKPLATDDAEVMEAETFLETLGAERGIPCGACGTLSWLAGMFKLNKEDELLLQNRRRLLHHAFPTQPWFRFFHGLVMVLFNLSCFAVPGALAGFCMLQVPLLQNVELLGGSLHPAFKPRHEHFYIQLQDGWTEGISMTMELAMGKASAFEFCCSHRCAPISSKEHGNVLLLKPQISKENFGTCTINLYGMRFKEYRFTVLALQGLSISSALGQEQGHFERFHPEVKMYNASFVSGKPAKFSLDVVPEVEMKNVQVNYTAEWCLNGSCREHFLPPRSQGSHGSVHISKPPQAGCFSLTLWIKLSPASLIVDVNSAYNISVDVIDLEMKLEEIALRMSELQARWGTFQDFDRGSEALKKETQLSGPYREPHSGDATEELMNAESERDKYLLQAYTLKPENKDEASPTFLAVGLTGTGKSEMCYWMTGDLANCNPSGSMQSNTSQVSMVKAYPFNDPKMGERFRWIDTPGRGDTRGEGNDTSMWNDTMNFLVNMSKSGPDTVDRIVWVINAAWQRATAARTMIFRELRRSFGLHLFKHLDLVFNFLAHGPNKTAYDKDVLEPTRSKFIEWIREQEIELFNWSNTSSIWCEVERQINETGSYGVSIHPEYLKKLPAKLPLSAPHLDRFYPFSHPAGVRELMKMYENARKKRELKVKGLDLKNRHPPIGPGVLEQMAASYRCGLLVKDSLYDDWLKVGVAAVHMKLTGKYFSGDDRAVLLPRGECGDPDFANWQTFADFIQAPSKIQNVSVDAADQVADYWFHWFPEPAGSDLQLCFCEAPKCTTSWRFGQSILDFPPIKPVKVEAQCSKMIATIPITGKAITSMTSSPGSWARVGNKLFGMSWGQHEGVVLDLTNPKEVSSSRPGFPEKMCGGAPSSAVVNDCVYAPPFFRGEKFLVIVNASSSSATCLPNSAYMKGSDEHLFSAIVAVKTTLYLIPRFHSRKSLLSIDVSSNVPWFQDIPFDDEELTKCLTLSTHSGSLGEDRGFFGQSLWFDAVQVDGSLFTSPHNAECMLVYHTGNQSFETVDTRSLRTGPAKWTRLLEANGILYAAPVNHPEILTVKISTKEVKTIHAVRPKSQGMVYHNNHLYYLSGLSGVRMLKMMVAVDLETEVVRQFEIQNLCLSCEFGDATGADDKLYALPSQGTKAILVLDFNLELNGTEAWQDEAEYN
eukprot:s1172_g1.t1